jgi:hypothetical protein
MPISKSKKIAIIQSNYIPWKGYFDIINSVDEFILYDDMQYTRRDWRNRNKIITSKGIQWLTVPVEVKGKYYQKINETRISDPKWAKKHWASLIHNYRNAPYFKNYKELFETLYLGMDEIMLSQVNYLFIKAINYILGITTTIRWSSEFELIGGKTEKLLGICESVGATEYLSGPSAKGYLDESLFIQKGISVNWIDYTCYPEYSQQHSHPFEHGVTILDLLFNTGEKATTYMKSFGKA